MENKPKQVIVIRKDLNMRKGKIAAQAAHASMKVLLDNGYKQSALHYVFSMTPAMNDWLSGAFTKICVYVNSEEELDKFYNLAKEKKILCSMIVDNGLTEFNGVPTKTCIAVGPDYSDKVDEVTGGLPLF